MKVNQVIKPSAPKTQFEDARETLSDRWRDAFGYPFKDDDAKSVGVRVNQDGSISLTGQHDTANHISKPHNKPIFFIVEQNGSCRLRYRIKNFSGALRMLDVSTLEGLPKKSPRGFLVIESTFLKNLQFIPEQLDQLTIMAPNCSLSGGKTWVDWRVQIMKTKNNSLSGIADVIQYTRELLVWPATNKDLVWGGMLNVLKIGQRPLVFDSVGRPPSPTPMTKAIKIIQKYSLATKKDLLACQEELIDAGLEEFADL